MDVIIIKHLIFENILFLTLTLWFATGLFYGIPLDFYKNKTIIPLDFYKKISIIPLDFYKFIV